MDAQSGELIKAAPAQETVRVFDKENCAALQRMLESVVEKGTAVRAKPDRCV